jgi:hypothetical protein
MHKNALEGGTENVYNSKPKRGGKKAGTFTMDEDFDDSSDEDGRGLVKKTNLKKPKPLEN